MTNKETLLGEYATQLSETKNNNLTHIFRNLLSGLRLGELFLEESDLPQNHPQRKNIKELMSLALKLILAYKYLLDDFPDFREHELTANDAGTASKYVTAKYLELRGKPIDLTSNQQEDD